MSKESLEYIVLLEAIHPTTFQIILHSIILYAYSPTDAVQQAMIEFDARQSLLEKGYQIKIITVAPATEKSIKRVENIRQELQLLLVKVEGDKPS